MPTQYKKTKKIKPNTASVTNFDQYPFSKDWRIHLKIASLSIKKRNEGLKKENTNK